MCVEEGTILCSHTYTHTHSHSTVSHIRNSSFFFRLFLDNILIRPPHTSIYVLLRCCCCSLYTHRSAIISLSLSLSPILKFILLEAMSTNIKIISQVIALLVHPIDIRTQSAR